MFYPLRAYLVSTFSADPLISSLLAQRADGAPAIYPFHHVDVENPTYPLMTIDRFGSMTVSNKFQNTSYGNLIDAPKFSVCVWDKRAPDYCEQIYSRVRDMLMTGIGVGNSFFGTSSLSETITRSDLYDDDASAYHFHSEWQCWIFENATSRQPIPG
jgi:hypothetical protein